MNINLHIERVVLDGVGVGVAPGERHLLQANLTSELTQLLINGGLAGNLVDGIALSRLSTSDIQLSDTKPVELGQKIAQSVHGGIGHE